MNYSAFSSPFPATLLRKNGSVASDLSHEITDGDVPYSSLTDLTKWNTNMPWAVSEWTAPKPQATQWEYWSEYYLKNLDCLDFDGFVLLE